MLAYTKAFTFACSLGSLYLYVLCYAYYSITRSDNIPIS